MKHPEDTALWLLRKNREEIKQVIERANKNTTFDGKPRTVPPMAEKFAKALEASRGEFL